MSKKFKTLNLVIYIPLYDSIMVFSFGSSNKRLRKFLEDAKIKMTEDELKDLQLKPTEKGCCQMFKCGTIFVLMPCIPSLCVEYGTLQHEIFHAVTMFLQRRGFKLKQGYSDEAYAYLIGYITEEVYKEINKTL